MPICASDASFCLEMIRRSPTCLAPTQDFYISVLTEMKGFVRILSMELKPISQRFVLHWGEMGSQWGVNRTVAQIHALLFVAGRPMHAEEIASTLGVARSNVSNSLRELQSWKLIRVVHLLGDRRDHFDCTTAVWELFKTVVTERKAREFDPTITVLRECLKSPEIGEEDAGTQLRIKETLALMEILSSWADEMLRLEPETLMRILKLGARIQGFVRGSKKDS
ncbi:MarR family transcriptional regulator [Uliginosibacterium sp. H3]|uniref:MarR family transcriptional regulator n=1 Tax=Uliginosibacterium silvisoli TaxID=3114758 RepID=A0ABU6K7S9_9RHOO|nr:MarR family transcriptional regulator [Uliginosibacterium sp. H3]